MEWIVGILRWVWIRIVSTVVMTMTGRRRCPRRSSLPLVVVRRRRCYFGAGINRITVGLACCTLTTGIIIIGRTAPKRVRCDTDWAGATRTIDASSGSSSSSSRSGSCRLGRIIRGCHGFPLELLLRDDTETAINKKKRM